METPNSFYAQLRHTVQPVLQHGRPARSLQKLTGRERDLSPDSSAVTDDHQR
jgi:hypothetical protein